MAVIEITFTYDFVCAWCYIAKRNLDAAIALYRKTYPGGRDDVFAITWAPYYLDYNPHPHAIDKLAHADVILADRTPEQRAALTKRMNAAGRAAGIVFDWGGTLGPGHATRDAHRLVRLVCEKEGGERQGELVEAVMEAYHCRKGDVAEHQVLREAAARAGVGAVGVEKWLASDEAGEAVDSEAARNKAAGTGVPVVSVRERQAEGMPDIMDLMEMFIEARQAEDEVVE
ncbi:DSBA-like thioredoxin domain-containing protein [Plectosphaerella plurivora]|uniref:DSBA-like thioredoxin domain-containing protein n=1 Tax=Plectosphaerella plurivora TaxID=936078 RepID=A0A9P8V898_9PEZI|nr:DSBA-like thioredoxin domain-containing protein [Plectosphaerella plurivora]